MIDLNGRFVDLAFTEAAGKGGKGSQKVKAPEEPKKRTVDGTIGAILKSASETRANSKVGKAAGAAGQIKKGTEDVERVVGNQVLDRRSIIARASQSVMQFPIYITQSNRIAEAHTIGKLFERVYASFVQNVIAQNPVITDISKVNGLKFLRDYHTNIKESSELTIEEFRSIFNEYCEPIDQLDEIMTEAVINELNLPGGTVTFLLARPNRLINLESQRLSHEPLEGFRYLVEAGPTPGGPTHQETTQKVNRAGNKVGSQEVELTEDMIQANADQYLKDLGLEAKAKKERWTDIGKVLEIKDHIANNGIIRLSDGTVFKANKDKNGDLKFFLVKGERSGESTTTTTTTKSWNDAMRPAVDTPVMLRDSDIKKFNGLQPFQFVVKFRVDPVYNDDGSVRGGTNYEQSYILGVKTVMHLVNVKDLSNDLRDIINGDRKSLQKVRYKTGEISWLKDYLLNLPGLKADAAKNLDDRRWLSTLKRLGEYERLHGTALKGPANAIHSDGVPIPNATLVVTRGDVERMKDETGIDIEKIVTARTLAKRLFLISVVIVDQTAGNFKVFFPDMDNDWDVQSMGAIDADVAKIDNSPLMNEINRLSRKG